MSLFIVADLDIVEVGFIVVQCKALIANEKSCMGVSQQEERSQSINQLNKTMKKKKKK